MKPFQKPAFLYIIELVYNTGYIQFLQSIRILSFNLTSAALNTDLWASFFQIQKREKVLRDRNETIVRPLLSRWEKSFPVYAFPPVTASCKSSICLIIRMREGKIKWNEGVKHFSRSKGKYVCCGGKMPRAVVDAA